MKIMQKLRRNEISTPHDSSTLKDEKMPHFWLILKITNFHEIFYFRTLSVKTGKCMCPRLLYITRLNLDTARLLETRSKTVQILEVRSSLLQSREQVIVL